MNDELAMHSEIADDDWSSGPRDAPVTLVEYLDFECPHCRRLHGSLQQLRERYGDTLRLVVRHFPLATQHPHAQAAAEAAEAAGVQGKFWELHDRLLRHEGLFEMADFLRYAGELGLDRERFARHLAEGSFRDHVRHDVRLGAGDGVTSTPTLFINGRRYNGPRDVAALGSAINAALNS